jgi:hypothetical protein
MRDSALDSLNDKHMEQGNLNNLIPFLRYFNMLSDFRNFFS